MVANKRLLDCVENCAELDEQFTPFFSGRGVRRNYAAHAVAELDTTGVENLGASGYRSPGTWVGFEKTLL
jgi:hypothetical protein